MSGASCWTHLLNVKHANDGTKTENSGNGIRDFQITGMKTDEHNLHPTNILCGSNERTNAAQQDDHARIGRKSKAEPAVLGRTSRPKQNLFDAGIVPSTNHTVAVLAVWFRRCVALTEQAIRTRLVPENQRWRTRNRAKSCSTGLVLWTGQRVIRRRNKR